MTHHIAMGMREGGVKTPTLRCMRDQFSGAVIRLHGPLNLQLWDRLTAVVGVLIGMLALPLLLDGEVASGLVALAGGALIVVHGRHEQRRHQAMIWAFAAIDEDPVQALAMYEYLYRVRFRDLLVLADWRTERERLGLPVLDDCGAPIAVRALVEYLRANPREV